MASGRDARRLAADILDHLRNGFLATMARGLVMLPDDAAVRVEEQARRLGPAALVRAMEGIGEALAEMRDSVDPRVTLEVALVRLARPDVDRSPAALLERIERLERTIGKAAPRSDGGTSAPAAPPPAPSVPSPVVPSQVDAGAAPPAVPSQPPAVPSQPPAVSSQPPAVPSQASAMPAQAGPGPTPPGGPDSPASKPALGAHRSPPPPVARSAPQPGPPAAPQVPPAPGPPSAATGPTAGGRPTAPTPTPATPPAPAAGALPTRDELTMAWGDGVLRGLPGKARSRFASGRFLGVEGDAAIFAVPDKHLMGRCEEVRADTEEALAARFGRPVPIRLVLDPGGPAIEPPGGAPTAPVLAAPPDLRDSPAEYNLDEMEDAGPAVTSPEQRLLEAFPGAEEVSP
jgi:DNA polymerase-3 subunit gamma/tau